MTGKGTSRLLVAAALLLTGRIAAAADATAPPASIRVGVLKLRSFVAKSEDLATLSAQLAQKIGATEGVLLVDPVAPLVEKGADDWLKADKLLYDGIQDYGDLRFNEAEQKLREAIALSQASYREYADAQGPRRMREAYLYLGLARLEEGEEADALEWFTRAATVDPAFEPDPRNYPPAARAKYQHVHDSLSGPAYGASREILEPMAEKVGADVLVTGGVTKSPSGKLVLEIVIDDRWKGRLFSSSLPAGGSLDETIAALGAEMPRLVAQIQDKAFDPGVVARAHRRVDVGYAFLLSEMNLRGPIGGSHYHFARGVPFSGVAVGFTPSTARPLSVEATLQVFPPQPMPAGGFRKEGTVTNVLEGRIVFSSALDSSVVIARGFGLWGVKAGAGLVVNQAIIAIAQPNFAQSTNVVVLSPIWLAPIARLGATRVVGRSGFVQLQIAGEYDGLASQVGLNDVPSDWSIRSMAMGGVTF